MSKKYTFYLQNTTFNCNVCNSNKNVKQIKLNNGYENSVWHMSVLNICPECKKELISVLMSE